VFGSLGFAAWGFGILDLRYSGWPDIEGFGTLGGVRSLGVWILGLRCLGVRNFGSTVFWLAGYLDRVQHTWISVSRYVVVRCGSYGSSVFPRVAWHAGSCFSAAFDASTRLGTFQ
jgi:hypothetical protein